MVGKVDFQIKGAKEMENLLMQLGPKVANQVGRSAVRAGAKPIVDDAKSRVRKVSGNLERGIKAIVPRRSADNQVMVLIGFSSEPVADSRRDSGVDIVSRRAHLQEFGSSRQAAHPFIRPALDSKIGDALNAMGKTLATGIEREAKKLAKPR